LFVFESWPSDRSANHERSQRALKVRAEGIASVEHVGVVEITWRGQVRSMIEEKGGVDTTAFIEFLKRLIWRRAQECRGGASDGAMACVIYRMMTRNRETPQPVVCAWYKNGEVP
jgi:hypothetical protein